MNLSRHLTRPCMLWLGLLLLLSVLSVHTKPGALAHSHDKHDASPAHQAHHSEHNHEHTAHSHSESHHEHHHSAPSTQHTHKHTPAQLSFLHAIFPKDPAYAALTATAYVSVAPIAVLLFMPTHTNEAALNTLVAFAVGSLLGDVFLHLLPHAFAPHSHDDHDDQEHDHHDHSHEHTHDHDHDHDHDHTRGLYIGLAVLAGFMAFFSIDRGMRLVGSQYENEDGHGHHHHHHQVEDKTAAGSASKGQSTAVASSNTKRRKGKKDKAASQADSAPAAVASGPSFSLRLSAYLNLFADATHNFTDGLAIAAAFYASHSLGITTTVACFFHEIPHEIGDYAILLRSGFGRARAAVAQGVTALGAFAGAAAGIWLKSRSAASTASHDGAELDLVMPFTAGGFVYVATVGVVPELLAARGVGLKHSVMQVIAMAVGVALMALIALNE